MTLIDVRLIHTNHGSEIKEEFISYGYNLTNKIKFPLFRGNEKYGTISVFSIEKVIDKL